jgi:hypothetical protein
MTNKRVTETLNALVDEAYKRALDQGQAITNPDKWRAWKRSVYVDTARREGPGYLRHHHQRLGLNPNHPQQTPCYKCGQPIIGQPWTPDNDTTEHCSPECAGVQTLTLDQYLDTLTPDQRQTFQRLTQSRQEAKP